MFQLFLYERQRQHEQSLLSAATTAVGPCRKEHKVVNKVIAFSAHPPPPVNTKTPHCVSQEDEERHRQALWADEGTNGASFLEDDGQEEGGSIIGNDELQDMSTWRLVLRRVVDHAKFQVRCQAMHFTIVEKM